MSTERSRIGIEGCKADESGDAVIDHGDLL